jgi:hypothetical protein
MKIIEIHACSDHPPVVAKGRGIPLRAAFSVLGDRPTRPYAVREDLSAKLAEPDTLVVSVGFQEREGLLEIY